jgi:DNA-binding LacI/PurR family transcriptional regulator
MNKEIKKIYTSLLKSIISGKIKHNDTLPREIDLATKFNTNYMNAKRAVNALAGQNIVTRKKRIGTTVNSHLDYENLKKLLKETNLSIYVLYSTTQHWIHWNETSFLGLEEILEPKGFSVSYSSIPANSGRAEYKKLLDNISNAGASALVIFPDIGDTRFLCKNADLLLNFNMPIYMLNRSGEPIPLDMVSFVSADPFGDGFFVGSLLKKNNFHNVLVTQDLDGLSFWSKKRLEGIEMSMTCGQSDSKAIIHSTLGNFQGMSEAVEIIKQTSGNIVVVAVNNEYAAKLIDLCNEKKLTIPKHYQLITFDDNPLYRSYNLTSMGIPMKEVGQSFGHMICDNSWIGKRKGKLSLKLNSKLIVRETLKPKII